MPIRIVYDAAKDGWVWKRTDREGKPKDPTCKRPFGAQWQAHQNARERFPREEIDDG